jgi:hypothetical protein
VGSSLSSMVVVLDNIIEKNNEPISNLLNIAIKN